MPSDVSLRNPFTPIATCLALDRSMRDGYAVRSADLPGRASVVGQVRAGETFSGAVEWCEAVEIMTGAPVPKGTDAVIMLEHVTRKEDVIEVERTVKAGENINPRGIEAKAGTVVLEAGKRHRVCGNIAAGNRGMLARSACYRKPAGCHPFDGRRTGVALKSGLSTIRSATPTSTRWRPR